MEQPQPGSRRFAVWMGLATLVVIIDQYTKYLVIRAIEYGQPPIPFGSSNILALTHQRNFGAAWSLLADAGGWQRWFFVVLATAVSGVLGVWLWRIRQQRFVVLSAGLALVLGGAVGNLVDRLLLGYVTDFIQVRFAGVPFFDPFPSFNVADAAITVGAILLIVDSFFLFGQGNGGQLGRVAIGSVGLISFASSSRYMARRIFRHDHRSGTPRNAMLRHRNSGTSPSPCSCSRPRTLR